MQSNSNYFRVGQCNILGPEAAVPCYRITGNLNPGVDRQGHSNWLSRKFKVVTNIQNSRAAVVTLQECSARSFVDIINALGRAWGGYQVNHGKLAPIRWIKGRCVYPKKGVYRGHGVAIIYRKSAFRQIAHHVGKDQDAKRRHLAVDLQRVIYRQGKRKYGRVSRFVSCHLVGGPQRALGDRQLGRVKLFASQNTDIIHNVFISGDFNQDTKTKSPRIGTLIKAGYLTDGQQYATEVGTNRHIDWTWLKTRCQGAGDTIASRAARHQDLTASDHKLSIFDITCTHKTTLFDKPRAKQKAPAHRKVRRHAKKPKTQGAGSNRGSRGRGSIRARGAGRSRGTGRGHATRGRGRGRGSVRARGRRRG